jgi:lipopolysaccharide cholinephosphotransferase
MREYDKETLQKVQQIELMILRDSLKICQKYNVKFFLIGGSAIGAIRHQGFIPWDDDIDVAMMRKDYDEFIKRINEEMPDKYIAMNTGTDKNYPLMTTRLMLKGTKFVEEPLKDIHCFLGIFLDMYVLDNLPDNPEELNKISRKSFILSKLQILRSIAFPVLPYKGAKAKLTHVITGIAHGVLTVFGISKEKLYKKAIRIAAPYKNLDNSKKVGFLFDTYPDYEIYDRTDIFPLRIVKFNGLDVYMPCNVEKSLTDQYGDYMQMPPVEKRKNHFPYELDFGKYANISAEEIAAGKYDAEL